MILKTVWNRWRRKAIFRRWSTQDGFRMQSSKHYCRKVTQSSVNRNACNVGHVSALWSESRFVIFERSQIIQTAFTEWWRSGLVGAGMSFSETLVRVCLCVRVPRALQKMAFTVRCSCSTHNSSGFPVFVYRKVFSQGQPLWRAFAVGVANKKGFIYKAQCKAVWTFDSWFFWVTERLSFASWMNESFSSERTWPSAFFCEYFFVSWSREQTYDRYTCAFVSSCWRSFLVRVCERQRQLKRSNEFQLC